MVSQMAIQTLELIQVLFSQQPKHIHKFAEACQEQQEEELMHQGLLVQAELEWVSLAFTRAEQADLLLMQAGMAAMEEMVQLLSR